MEPLHPNDSTPRHHRITRPSPWFVRFAPLAGSDGPILDVACGNGRHGRIFLARGRQVVFVDRDVTAVRDLEDEPAATVLRADLENGELPPFAGRTFAAVLVSNYLYRPLFPALMDAVGAGGILVYETFARGNEVFARPRNPDHLLRAGELLEAVRGRFQVIAYEHGITTRNPIPGVVQRICAIKDLQASERASGEPPAHPLNEG